MIRANRFARIALRIARATKFLTLEVVLFLTLVSLYVFPYLGLFGFFFFESHVGTSVVLLLTLENVGVIFYNTTCFFFFFDVCCFFLFFLFSFVLLYSSMLGYRFPTNKKARPNQEQSQKTKKEKQQGNKEKRER